MITRIAMAIFYDSAECPILFMKEYIYKKFMVCKMYAYNIFLRKKYMKLKLSTDFFESLKKVLKRKMTITI